MNRRDLLRSLAATTAASVLPFEHMAAAVPSQDFNFLFFTDTHIQPELDAAHGCGMAFQKIAAMKPDFAIHGGDPLSARSYLELAIDPNEVARGLALDELVSERARRFALE